MKRTGPLSRLSGLFQKFIINSLIMFPALLLLPAAGFGDEWTVYNTGDSGLPGNVTAIAIAPNNDKWIGTDNGVAKYDGNSWTVYNTDNSVLPVNGIKSIAIEENGYVWVGTSGSGAARFDGNNWTLFNESHSALLSSTIYDMTIDNNGDIWFAAGGGAVKYDGNTWTDFTKDNSDLPNSIVLAIESDNSGNIWLGTREGFLQKYYDVSLVYYNGIDWTVYHSQNSSLNGIVQTIAIDNNNVKWIGSIENVSGRGLITIDGINWSKYDQQNSDLPSTAIYTIGIDNNDDKWIGTYNGLVKFDGNDWTIYNTSNSGLPSNEVNTIAIDSNGNIWIGTDSSLSIFTPASGVTIIEPNGSEELTIGDNYTITWSSQDIQNIKIELSTDNGSSWDNIIASTPADAASYSWDVPDKSSTECLIRISDVDDAGVNDVSDAVFTIIPESGTLVLDVPNGGEEYEVDSTVIITWSGVSAGETVRLEYSTNNGTDWLLITDDASGNQYSWPVPKTASTECLVRVIMATNSEDGVSICNQYWMGENLDVDHYANGDPIPEVTDAEEWGNLTTGAWCYYNNDQSNGAIYGKLYNWYAVNDPRGLAPDGWVIPTGNDWDELSNCLGSDQGGKLKEVGTDHWLDPNNGATDQYGFTALPGGYRDTLGGFKEIGAQSRWWSSSESDDESAGYQVIWNDVSVMQGRLWFKNAGFSVRCYSSIQIDTSDAVFTIKEKETETLVLDVPNGGEEYEVNSTATITWSGVPAGETVRLEYSTNNGTDWQLITDDATGNQYSWTAPDVESDQCLVRVISLADIQDEVEICSQTWMGMNLNVDTYRNGDPIPQVTDPTEWENLTTGAWCYYNNDSTNEGLYGKLYNWYAVNDPRGLAPEGWHIPTDDEWKELEMCLGMSQAEADAVDFRGTEVGGKLRSKGTIEDGNGLWHFQVDVGTTNSSRFTALPGGYCNIDGSFRNLNIDGYWWSSSEDTETGAWLRYLYYNISGVGRFSLSKGNGYSVRCIKGDATPGKILNLNEPSGDETLEFNEEFDITWSSENVSTIKIEFTKDDGTTWASVADDVDASLGTYKWTTANYPSDQCKIRITDTDDDTVYSENSTLFDIEIAHSDEVVIGSQTWATRNLDVTTYRNGDPIPQVTDSLEWSNLTTGAWCYYENDSENGKIYGKLYNWYAVNDSRGLAPEGWHVPSDEEWKEMESYLGMSDIEIEKDSYERGTDEGLFLKSTGTIDGYNGLWGSPNNGATNTTKFSALPGGNRDYMGAFDNIGNYSSWWSSSVADTNAGSVWFRYLSYNNAYVARQGLFKSNGYSVRCIKGDATPGKILNLNEPSGDETLEFNEEFDITWSSQNVSTIKIEFTKDDGATWASVADDVDASLGTYKWTTANYPSDQCKIRITDTDDDTVYSANSTSFEIEIAHSDEVVIGNQTWATRNLDVTTYRNGDPIPQVTDSLEWSNLTTGAWCYYENDSENGKIYGKLYNWYAVNDSRGLAPEGWHVPSDDEWKELETYIGMSQSQADSVGSRGTIEGGLLKSTGNNAGGTGLWSAPNDGVTNSSNFSALPGGWREYSGSFNSISSDCLWWSSTEFSPSYAWARGLYYYGMYIDRGYSHEGRAFSVRCVKD